MAGLWERCFDDEPGAEAAAFTDDPDRILFEPEGT
jgi:hypothetical protein